MTNKTNPREANLSRASPKENLISYLSRTLKAHEESEEGYRLQGGSGAGFTPEINLLKKIINYAKKNL